MTEQSAQDPRAEALQAVIDRVVSYEESATEATIRTEVEDGLREAEVTLDPARLDELVERISTDPEGIRAEDYLG